MLSRPAKAESDAEESLRLDPLPSRLRLLQRARVAAGKDLDLRSTPPEDLALWPAGGPAMTARLRSAAARLRPVAAGEGPEALAALWTRAVLLSALGEHEAAEAEATRAVTRAPLSASVYELRGRVRRRRGDRGGALLDLERGLRLEPSDA